MVQEGALLDYPCSDENTTYGELISPCSANKLRKLTSSCRDLLVDQASLQEPLIN